MAQNIWDDAFKNTLHKPDRLERHLAKDPASINKPGGAAMLTPLAGACYNGHIDVVTLLLKHGADPNAPCPHGRTALFYIIKQCPQHQLAIVDALLAKGADPNEVYPEDDNANPLTLAIDEAQDKDIVRALIKAGAKPTPENEKLAKKKKMTRDLRPINMASLVDLAVSAVSLVIAYTDSGLVDAVTKGMVKKLYKITSAKDNLVGSEIPEPKSVDDFKKNIDIFVANAGLGKFFEKKPEFLRTLAEKASNLRSDPTTDLGTPGNLKRLTRLSVYQLVIYCDDSGSMSYDNRYINQRALVSRITNVSTKLVPDDVGIELRFINDPFSRTLTATEVDAAMASVSPTYSTQLGTNLVRKILQPLVYDKFSDPNHEFERPLLVCVITDGVPDSDDFDIKQAIINCKTSLIAHKYEATSVMFCISQIGNDSGAKDFLDRLRGETTLEDVLHCTAEQLDAKFAELRDNERQLEVWLLEMLTKPIMGDP